MPRFGLPDPEVGEGRTPPYLPLAEGGTQDGDAVAVALAGQVPARPINQPDLHRLHACRVVRILSWAEERRRWLLRDRF